MLVFLITAIGLSLAYISGKMFRDYANPLSVYAIVWTVTVALFHLNLVEYDVVGASTWSAVGVSFTAFLLGGWSAYLWVFPKSSVRDPVAFPLDRVRLERLLWIVLLLGGIGFYLQLYHLQETVGLGLFLESPIEARRQHSNVKYWGYFNLLNVANVAFVTLYRFRFGAMKVWMWLCPLIALGSSLLTTDRTRFFYMALWAFFTWLYLTGGLRWSRNKIVGLALVLAGLLCFFVVIGNHYKRNYLTHFHHHIHFHPRLEFLIDPYIYLTGTLPALDALMRDENPHYLGRFSLSPVVSVLNIVAPELEPVAIQGKIYDVPMEINTYSYLQQFYQDFGWIGFLVGPFVCGFLACWAYGAMRRRPSFFRVYLAALLAYCCAISVFVNMFTQEATWFFVAVGWLASRYLRPGQESVAGGSGPTTATTNRGSGG